MAFYHKGSRELQDRFSTRNLADRADERLVRKTFSEQDKQFIESCSFFFLATADDEGKPDCSYKGGLSGFVQVLDSKILTFPSFDGNGMFKSFGNIVSNPAVGLLFIDFENPRRLRVNGTASIEKCQSGRPELKDAHFLIRVKVEFVYPNCPRYINKMKTIEIAPDAPREGHVPPTPEWKTRPEYKEVLPPDDGT